MFRLILIIIFLPLKAFALEDSLLKTMEVLGHANKVQSERLKIASENLANEDSVGMTPGADPYRRKVVFVKNTYDRKLKTRIAKIKKYDVDKSNFKLKYDPNHPAADANGYVKLPNVNKAIEKADASEAQRSYEANLGMMEVSKQMISRTLEAMR